MHDLGDVVNDIEDCNVSEFDSIYDIPKFNILYDSFYRNHYDYNSQAEYVIECSKYATPGTIIEGACGTGRGIESLLDSQRDYSYSNIDRILGVDESLNMLQLANDIVSDDVVTFVQDRIEYFSTPHDVTLVYILGNSFAHISPMYRVELFKNVYDMLSSGGVFTFSYVDSEKDEMFMGGDISDTYETDDYVIKRRMEILEDNIGYNIDMQYSIYSNETSDRTNIVCNTKMNTHKSHSMLNELVSIGFADVESLNVDGLRHSVIKCIK